MRLTAASPAPDTVESSRSTTRRWLLFIPQLPTRPSNLRVRTWRRMQQLGALPVKQAVYALPDSAQTREDFEWLRSEIVDAGGDVALFTAENLDTWADDSLLEEFRASCQASFSALAADIERTIARFDSPRRRKSARSPSLSRAVDGFRQRFAAIERADFFGAAGRDRVVVLLDHLEQRRSQRRPAKAADESRAPHATYHDRLWVTRPRPGVDRMASAWLITRFIDATACFAFAPDRDSLPEGALPFDLFGVEFSHHDGGCTFETLCAIFKIRHPAIDRIAAIVHDLDLKDGRLQVAEAAVTGTVIEGLQLAHTDDSELLRQGIALFEALYRSFERATRSARPRAVASRRKGQAAARARKRK